MANKKTISYRLSRDKVISRNNKPKVVIDDKSYGQPPADQPQHKATIINTPKGVNMKTKKS